MFDNVLIRRSFFSLRWAIEMNGFRVGFPLFSRNDEWTSSGLSHVLLSGALP